MKPLTTMLMIGERERETATVVRVYCNTVNKYAYINLVSLSHSLSLSLSSHDLCTWKWHIIAYYEWRNTSCKTLLHGLHPNEATTLHRVVVDVVSRTHCGGFVIVESNFERVAFDSCVMFIKKFCQYNLTWFVSLPVRLHTHTHTQSI